MHTWWCSILIVAEEIIECILEIPVQSIKTELCQCTCFMYTLTKHSYTYSIEVKHLCVQHFSLYIANDSRVVSCEWISNSEGSQ